MKNILVLFGSKSDEYIYTDIVESLKSNFNVSFEILSAHRDPTRLIELLKKDKFDYILAGAGLAASLPGFCASHTNKPVFGIPVAANLGGLDALLSILQMPFGVPVGTLSPRCISSLTSFLTAAESIKTRTVNVVVSPDVENHEFAIQEYARLEHYAQSEGIEVNRSNSIDEELINIVLVHSEHNHEVKDNALYVPLLSNSEKNSPTSSIRLLDIIERGGIWFGINNSRNALRFFKKFL